ncbi:flotillin domain-containing protein [Arthrobacter alpinus]|nr:flotillin domain-containing protein [Arthrobacter alpinus]
MVEARGRADAAVIKSRGQAEAESTEAKGVAEAAGIAAQAEAYEKFNEAAILSKVLEVLPAMAREVAAPMAAIKEMTVISNDGASQLSKNVSNGVQQTTQLIKDSTGLDIIGLLQGMVGERPRIPRPALQVVFSAPPTRVSHGPGSRVPGSQTTLPRTWIPRTASHPPKPVSLKLVKSKWRHHGLIEQPRCRRLFLGDDPSCAAAIMAAAVVLIRQRYPSSG